MLRGVNKTIIEILETENQYFEKVILFVRPTHLEKDKTFLDDKAKEYMSKIDYKDKNASPDTSSSSIATAIKNKPFMLSALKLCSAAVAGGAAVLLFVR